MQRNACILELCKLDVGIYVAGPVVSRRMRNLEKGPARRSLDRAKQMLNPETEPESAAATTSTLVCCVTNTLE